MAASTTTAAVRIAARRVVASAHRRLPPPDAVRFCTQTTRPLSTTAAAFPRPLHGPCPTAVCVLRPWAAAQQSFSTDHRPSDKTHNGQEGDQRHDARPNDTRRTRTRLTLYAGAGILSFLLALAQPLSFVQADHRADPESDAAGDHGINTGSAQAPATGDDRDPSLPRYRLSDVRKHDAKSGAPWVTSGDKVYDITDWVAAHPGGDIILRAAGRSIDPYWAIFSIHKAPHVREILDTYLVGLVDVADLDAQGRPVVLEGEGVEDPFAEDPARDSRFVVHHQKPCNAEPPAELVGRDFATPNELFYVRNHMWVPVVDAAEAGQHRLTVELPGGVERTYTLDELRTRFRVHRVAAVLQCSGNRRSDMTKNVGPTNGIQWTVGAISNAVWEGVLLRDVLADAGLRTRADVPAIANLSANSHANTDEKTTDDLPDPESLHVQLAGMESYGASIPLPVALDPRGDVLLAFGMNGEPLPPDHGYPLRAVVPGFVAARSVKWLSRIVVADEESRSQWQRRDYKLFGPNEGGKPNWDRYPAIQEMPVTSAITGVWVGQSAVEKALRDWRATQPAPVGDDRPLGSRAEPGVRDLEAWQASHWNTAGGADASSLSSSTSSMSTSSSSSPSSSPAAPKPTPVAVAGYAYSGGGREIARVDVSVDGGRTWDQAELLDQKTRPFDDDEATKKRYVVARGRPDWAWKRWRYRGVLLDGDQAATEIIVKATDSTYNTQPENHKGIYNVRGNLATAWHRVTVRDGKVEGCGFDKKEAK